MDNSAESQDGLTQFTTDFFDYFGAKVKLAGRKGKKYLNIKLPEPLQERFGKKDLKLVFSTTLSDSGHDLVATGSRIFDQMVQHLSECGALTLQELPMQYTGGESLMQAVRPINASISNLKMAEQSHNLFVYNWRIIYRADDKQEMLYTVVMDENGQRIPLSQESSGDRSVDIEELLSDAQPISPELDEDGNPLPTKLPPMTRLTELAENARRFAVYHADLHCVALESEIQPRLFKALSRLHGYYSQQIEEVYESHDPSGEKRKILETDLQRKLAEEVENHRLRVQIDLFSYAIIHMPVAVADVTLTDGKQDAAVRIRQNRYTGTLQKPSCYSCGQSIDEIAIDKSGHILCAECLNQCTKCMSFHCTTCGIHACPVCEQSNCGECSQYCWACGEQACDSHASQCPVCFDTVCHTCQTNCAHCETLQCVSHLRADCVATIDGKPSELSVGKAKGELESTSATQARTRPGKSTNALICNECAVRCAGCQQYSAHIGVCENSGQRFCLNCLGTCTQCSKTVGPSFHHQNPGDGLVYCQDCIDLCPSCSAPTSDVEECSECSKAGCTECHRACDDCEQQFCSEHILASSSCEHAFCSAHYELCQIGNEPICSVCEEPCAVCSRYYCAEHSATCELCRLTYCQECVRPGMQLCDTCATIRDDGHSVYMADEPIATNREVAPLVHRYRWQRAGNERYIIYLGQGPFNSGALVLVQTEPEGDVLLVVRKLSAIDQYWRRY